MFRKLIDLTDKNPTSEILDTECRATLSRFVLRTVDYPFLTRIIQCWSHDQVSFLNQIDSVFIVVDRRAVLPDDKVSQPAVHRNYN